MAKDYIWLCQSGKVKPRPGEVKTLIEGWIGRGILCPPGGEVS